ncbi:hypothetical protein PRK78_006379 [Emydomyces testavorans]|uniref:OTU domain-containing protein n=1 Tax=Emydomyces testavorans TaxID=2070801 RepID=A0AAF0DP22_9EURO|nr:hypothetical protein PRK78_006379 [Emydomyces testavorans]
MADSPLPPPTRIVPIMAHPKASARSAGRSARSSRRNSAVEADDAESRLKERLQKLNCYPAEIRGDGEYSIQIQNSKGMLYGTPERHDEVRQRLVDHIRENRDSFIHFVDLGPDRPRSTREASRQAYRSFGGVGSRPSMDRINGKFEEMLAKMGEPQEWGGAFELQAFCQAYVRDIIVYQADSVQEFTSNIHDAGSGKETVHLAYHEYQHYSSVRSLDGPHEGLPDLPRRLDEGETEDQAVKKDKDVAFGKQSVGTQTALPTPLTLAEPWKISTIAEALPGFDYDTIRAMLMKCRGDIEFAFSRLLDDDFSSSSQSSVVPTTATETSGTVGVSPGGINPATRAWLGSSSRSSSRHSTGSKRVADISSDDDDEEGPIRSGVRRRPARGRKRRILQDVTVGISVLGDHDDDVISIRLRVDPDAAVEPPKRVLSPQGDSGDEADEGAKAKGPEKEEESIIEPKTDGSDGTFIESSEDGNPTASNEGCDSGDSDERT